MKNIYILIFLFLAFSSNLGADDFDEFWYEDEVLTADEENLILLGSIMDGENVTGGAVVFDLDDYSYHSLKFDFDYKTGFNKPITNSTNNLIGIQTDSNFTVYNYKTRDFISQIDLTFSYSEIIIFPTKSNQLYIINYLTDSLNIIDIETGNSIEKKNIELMSEGYNYRGFNEFENYVVLTKGDSIVYFDLENDSTINKMKSNNDFDKLQFTDSGNLLVGIDSNKVIISNSFDFSLIRELDLDEVIIPQNSGITYDIWFSNKGKYMYINPAGISFMNIVDTESDTLIARTGSRYHTDRMFPLFITPDKSKAIGLESSGYWCDRGPLPRYQMFPFIYSPISENKIRPIPNTFVNNVESALFGNYHNKLAITSNIVSKGKETAILDENKKFIRYVFVDDTPVLFLDNENYLVYSNNDSLNFYNLDKNEFDKKIELYNSEGYSYKYYFTNDIIVAFNSDSIKIINYDNLTIENEYSIKEIGLDSNVKIDEIPRLVSYSNNSLNSFDVITELTETLTINGIPDGYDFMDFTPNGNYILYKNKDLKSGLYYTKTNTFKSHDMSNNQFVFENSYKYMLLGNFPIMYIAVNYQDDPDFDYYTFDFDKEESIEIGEENKYVYPLGSTRIYPFDNFFYNGDYSRMLGITCPYVTTLHKFRDPITLVETAQTEELFIYPNPTRTELNLDNLDYNQLTNVVIYDSYGKLVLSVGTINTSNKLNVESLPAGVYFLKSNEVQHKFVKY